MDIEPKVISYKAPWQNGIAERWILSARMDLLNHMIILSEEHLRQLLKKYRLFLSYRRLLFFKFFRFDNKSFKTISNKVHFFSRM